MTELQEAQARTKALLKATESYAIELEFKGEKELAGFYHARALGIAHALSVMQ